MLDINPKLKDTINNLPKTAGVYLFYEKPKPNTKYPTPIYIGKAINIKDRVKNHFMQPTYKDSVFVGKITKIDFINTNSEIEALVLEAQLIKKHLPKFNVVWKDGKNYFYVAITKSEKPIVFITHQKDSVSTKYIGPFIEGNALKKTLKYLRRVFPYYTSAKHPKNKCTWCHLGLCPGTNPNVVEYKKDLKKLMEILQGKRKTVLYALRREMEVFSNSQEYENAQKVHDKIRALEQIMQHTHVIESAKITNNQWHTTQKIMQEILGMKTTINKIECYDVSNIQGKFAVGSMVVFKNGAPDKSQYKKFRIRMKNEPNDIAMLREVLTRRLAHPEWGYPEVMLIDGGKAQLNVAINSKLQYTNHKQYQNSKNIKIISMAKGRRELFIEGQKKPIPLKDLPQEIYNVIVTLDDEAHRFAITYHKKVRKRALLDPKT